MGLFSEMWEAIRRFFGDTNVVSDLSDSPGNRLYVGNLSYRVKEEELRALFSKYGRVRALHLIRDRLTRRLKGYAFLEMAPEDAKKALELHGIEFLGRKLVVSIAKSRQRPQQRRQVPPRWKRRNRSGPRAYGPKSDDTPLQRYE